MYWKWLEIKILFKQNNCSMLCVDKSQCHLESLISETLKNELKTGLWNLFPTIMSPAKTLNIPEKKRNRTEPLLWFRSRGKSHTMSLWSFKALTGIHQHMKQNLQTQILLIITKKHPLRLFIVYLMIWQSRASCCLSVCLRVQVRLAAHEIKLVWTTWQEIDISKDEAAPW